MKRPEVSNELEGMVDLGMQREALRLAKLKLKAWSICGADFLGALHAILVQADRLKPWSPLVEAAYTRLSKREQRFARSAMLAFHYSARDYERASHFIPGRFNGGFDSQDLAFAVDTLFQVGKTGKANKLAKHLPLAMQNAESRMQKAMLAACMAESLARKGQWNEAIQIWEAVQSDDILSENAVTGIAEIHVARALRTIRLGLAVIERSKANFDPNLETTLPGNEKTRREQAEKNLRHLEKKLKRILPEKRQSELGFWPEGIMP
jgi:hypothetical protein